MMKTISKLLVIPVVLLVAISWRTKGDENETPEKDEVFKEGINMKEYALSGANILTFGPDNVLFVGDSKSAVVYAFETEATELKDPTPYNFFGVDKKIAEELGANPSDILIQDMKVHPLSQEAYISFKRGHSPDDKSFIAIVSPKDLGVSFLNIKKAKQSKTKVSAPATEVPNLWRDIPASTLNITDMDFHQGNLYVAGLTNGEFASTMRIIPFPFNKKQSKVGSIEMYHAVHTQMETRAPIRTMLFEELDGVETLVAAYTCTPLVTMPASALKDGNHIQAKTIAELGYGNAPIDMITFVAQEWDGSYDKKLLITNKFRSAHVISVKDLVKANQGEGLSGFTQGPEGVEMFPVPLSGVMHIDEQNQTMLVTLRRNIDTGTVDLLSKLKGSYFR
ncbi:MAG: hypothetical protein AAF789_13310, partial [Bacteroidota bacterium]